MAKFVRYDPYPGHEFGAGDFHTDDNQKMPMYDPGLAQQLLANNDLTSNEPNMSPAGGIPGGYKVGDAVMEDTRSVPDTGNYSPLRNPSKEVQSTASDYLKETGGKLGSSREMPNGNVMTVETHKPDASRGQTADHPGVTVKSPWNDSEQQALEGLVKKYPGTSIDDYTKVFNDESGLKSTAINRTPYTDSRGNTHPEGTGAAGLFQLMPDQAKALGVDDVTKLSRVEQIHLFDRYLQSKGVAPKSGDDVMMAIKAPAGVGQPDDKVIYPAGSDAALANKAWQDPQTGAVTAGSLRAYHNRDTGGGGGGSAPSYDPNLSQDANRAKNFLFAPVAGTSEMKTRTESGIPYSDADKSELHGRFAQQAQMMKDAYKPVIDAQADIQQHAIARGEEIKAAQTEAADKEAAARDKYDASMQRIQQAQKEVLEDKQPAPFEGNTFGGILAVVGQMLGAYGAAINKTPNFAMEIVNTGLKRDSDRWSQQHLDKKYKVESEKELTRDQWHDYQTQKAERQMQQRLYIDHELQSQMQLSKNAETQASLGKLLAQNQEKESEIDFSLKRLAYGKVITESTGTPGSTPSEELINKRAHTLLEGGMSPEDIAAGRGRPIPVKNEDLQKYTAGPREGVAGRADVDKAERGLINLAPTLGMQYDPEKRTFTDVTGEDKVPRMPLTGQALGPTGMAIRHPIDALFGTKGDEERKQAYSRQNTVILDALYARSGKAINKDEIQRTADDYKGLSRADHIAKFNTLMQELQQRKLDLASEFPGAEAAYEKRRTGEAEKHGVSDVDGSFSPGVSK